MKRILAPSILSADFKVLGEQMQLCADGGAEYLHFDVMDGMFVPNISFGIPVLECVKGFAGMVMDVHLMIQDPIRYVDKFCDAGADIVNVHYEACGDLQAVLDKIHGRGRRLSPPRRWRCLCRIWTRQNCSSSCRWSRGWGDRRLSPLRWIRSERFGRFWRNGGFMQIWRWTAEYTTAMSGKSWMREPM